jgi:hypothetical protein
MECLADLEIPKGGTSGEARIAASRVASAARSTSGQPLLRVPALPIRLSLPQAPFGLLPVKHRRVEPGHSQQNLAGLTGFTEGYRFPCVQLR